MCGGTLPAAGQADCQMGLSPRVRGNPVTGVLVFHHPRSIPACAGEPCESKCDDGNARVYPRVCGGTTLRPAGTLRRQGISPRVRGNPAPGRRRGCFPGYIPACAGEPHAGQRRAGVARVYPRVCGGTLDGSLPAGRPLGLSPRVRGNPAAHRLPEYESGSIPACAGEPAEGIPIKSIAEVYPRVCGGTPRPVGIRQRHDGLSPRVRGNRRAPRFRGLPQGSIPACAGEPPVSTGLVATSLVYPRVCGGTASSSSSVSPACGLSPRVRGNQAKFEEMTLMAGSIPACAGEPRWQQQWRRQCGVYPRVCGGTLPRRNCHAVKCGLSPRVRGNPG